MYVLARIPEWQVIHEISHMLHVLHMLHVMHMLPPTTKGWLRVLRHGKLTPSVNAQKVGSAAGVKVSRKVVSRCQGCVQRTRVPLATSD